MADRDDDFSVGESYLIFGEALVAASGQIDLATLTAAQGVVIRGVDPGDNSGRSVSSAGDVDGDGLDDLIIGAPAISSVTTPETGESYLIYGSNLAAEQSDDGLIDLNLLLF